jgi:hypothetical protein
VIGFTGGALNIVGILLAGLGLLADMLDRIRANQERILYFHKKNTFDGPQTGGPGGAPMEREPLVGSHESGRIAG